MPSFYTQLSLVFHFSQCYYSFHFSNIYASTIPSSDAEVIDFRPLNEFWKHLFIMFQVFDSLFLDFAGNWYNVRMCGWITYSRYDLKLVTFFLTWKLLQHDQSYPSEVLHNWRKNTILFVANESEENYERHEEGISNKQFEDHRHPFYMQLGAFF